MAEGTSPRRPSGLAGALICGVVAVVFFVGYFRADNVRQPLALLTAAILFAIPALAGLFELCFRGAAAEARGRVGRWAVGVFFLLFGALLVYGGLSPESRIRGGIPFLLGDAFNRALGQVAFTVVGALLILLGLIAVLARGTDDGTDGGD